MHQNIQNRRPRLSTRTVNKRLSRQPNKILLSALPHRTCTQVCVCKKAPRFPFRIFQVLLHFDYDMCIPHTHKHILFLSLVLAQSAPSSPVMFMLHELWNICTREGEREIILLKNLFRRNELKIFLLLFFSNNGGGGGSKICK